MVTMTGLVGVGQFSAKTATTRVFVKRAVIRAPLSLTVGHLRVVSLETKLPGVTDLRLHITCATLEHLKRVVTLVENFTPASKVIEDSELIVENVDG